MTYYVVSIYTTNAEITSPLIFEGPEALTAISQISNKSNAFISVEGEGTFIPYESVAAMMIRTETEDDEPVVDAVCNETNG